MVTTFTYKPSLVRSMNAISSYRGNRPTKTHNHTHKQTQRQDQLQYTVPQLVSTQCKYLIALHSLQTYSTAQKCDVESALKNWSAYAH